MAYYNEIMFTILPLFLSTIGELVFFLVLEIMLW